MYCFVSVAVSGTTSPPLSPRTRIPPTSRESATTASPKTPGTVAKANVYFIIFEQINMFSLVMCHAEILFTFPFVLRVYWQPAV